MANSTPTTSESGGSFWGFVNKLIGLFLVLFAGFWGGAFVIGGIAASKKKHGPVEVAAPAPAAAADAPVGEISIPPAVGRGGSGGGGGEPMSLLLVRRCSPSLPGVTTTPPSPPTIFKPPPPPPPGLNSRAVAAGTAGTAVAGAVAVEAMAEGPTESCDTLFVSKSMTLSSFSGATAAGIGAGAGAGVGAGAK
jgi:hypothetical protein